MTPPKTVKKKTKKKKVAKPVKKGEKKLRRYKTTVTLDVPEAASSAVRDTIDRSRTRVEAGLVYVSSFENISVQSLQNDPRFKHVKITTLHAWAKADGWHQQRKKMLANIKEGLEQRLSSKLTESIYQEVQNCIQLREMCIERLTKRGPDGQVELKPRSWEGVAKTLMETNKRLEEIRLTLSGAVAGAVPSAPPGIQQPQQQALPETTTVETPEYDPEELQLATQVILKKRREELRAREAERKDKEKTEKKKKLKLVNGGNK